MKSNAPSLWRLVVFRHPSTSLLVAARPATPAQRPFEPRSASAEQPSAPHIIRLGRETIGKRSPNTPAVTIQRVVEHRGGCARTAFSLRALSLDYRLAICERPRR